MDALIVICILLLMSYVFDLSAQKTRIPAIFFLLIIGAVLRQFVERFYPEIDALIDVNMVMPVIGNLGLILIVLEGSIELEIRKDKLPLLMKTFFIAGVSVVLISSISYYLIKYFIDYDFPARNLLLNIIPLAVISSAVAIPSARPLPFKIREFVIYESSFSDILGVLIFYFVLTNEKFLSVESFAWLFHDILIMVIISLIVSVILSLFLYRLRHHIKFIPIIIMIVLVFSIAKIYHLPSLVLILVFGLILKNLEKIMGFKWLAPVTRFIHPEALSRELKGFEIIVNEISFLVRTVFFILFGYSLDIADITNLSALKYSIILAGAIYLVRMLLLILFNAPLTPLLFISPRGLITILLFITIPAEYKVGVINNSVVIQVVLISIIVMMLGTLLFKKKTEERNAM